MQVEYVSYDNNFLLSGVILNFGGFFSEIQLFFVERYNEVQRELQQARIGVYEIDMCKCTRLIKACGNFARDYSDTRLSIDANYGENYIRLQQIFTDF